MVHLNPHRTKRAVSAAELRVAQAASVTSGAPPHTEMSSWRRWLHHPESLPAHRFLFQIHLWLGMLGSLYVFAMSISGTAIVFRNQLEGSSDPRLSAVIEWVVAFHSNFSSGDAGRLANGVGAIAVSLLCLTGAIIWWPGMEHWRRSLTVHWKSSFARINWDLHNALGFWCFLFVLMWGISGAYFVFPDAFNRTVDAISRPDSADKLGFGDEVLTWLSNLHFGRFNTFTEAIWVLVGLVPAVLSFTGIFMCCHRLLVRKGAPLPR